MSDANQLEPPCGWEKLNALFIQSSATLIREVQKCDDGSNAFETMLTAMQNVISYGKRSLNGNIAQATRIAELEKDADRYKKHCRNPQVAAWCGIDPNASDVLTQLDEFIDSAIQGEKQ